MTSDISRLRKIGGGPCHTGSVCSRLGVCVCVCACRLGYPVKLRGAGPAEKTRFYVPQLRAA